MQSFICNFTHIPYLLVFYKIYFLELPHKYELCFSQLLDGVQIVRISNMSYLPDLFTQSFCSFTYGVNETRASCQSGVTQSLSRSISSLRAPFSVIYGSSANAMRCNDQTILAVFLYKIFTAPKIKDSLLVTF